LELSICCLRTRWTFSAIIIPKIESHESIPRSGKRTKENIKPQVTLLLQPNLIERSKPSHLEPARGKKRKQSYLPYHASKRRKPTSAVSANNTDSIGHWIDEGRWPKTCFESEDNMSFLLAQKKSSLSLRRKASESSDRTPSD
jgi:hypothetical protein